MHYPEHYLKRDRCFHVGHIVAIVTFFFTLAIASLGVEIGGTASRNHSKWTERGKKPVLSFLLFSFLFKLRFLFCTSPCYLNALISQSSNGRAVPFGKGVFHVLVLNIVLWVSGLGDVKACMHLV